MTTLIVQYSGGRVVGRCDARCYDAEHEDCSCICGGKNHGKGRQQAIENTARSALDIIENWAAAQDLGIVDHDAKPSHTWNVRDGVLKIQDDNLERMGDPLIPSLFNTWADVMPEDPL